MSNRLKEQSSPYLLQHAENPVDWYPWCEEAFEKARREDKPVFLSVGYSTCHWCHVMAHESFENEEIADLLNNYFISIKVDREERPDIDSVYMAVCQAFTGNGGWPMSIFMTAEQKPFFAGTYFPPQSNMGMVGFRDLLLAIVQKWKDNRASLQQAGDQLLVHLKKREDGMQGKILHNLPEQAAEIFAQSFDQKFGGFGTAPKFPTPHNLIFLILYSHIYHNPETLKQAKFTLERMRRGGIFDHIGYGFSRYSTDNYYLVPHFEKMLYDNALLIMAYIAAYKATGDRIDLDTAEKTAAYVLQEMTNEEGAFYSAQDADSEGEEGKYYVWDFEEICRILGEESGKRFCASFGITREGNFEGRNIPNLLSQKESLETNDIFEEERQILYHCRKKRGKLHLDDKILTSWNSLMICAMGMLYRVTGKQKYLQAAKKSCAYIEKNLTEGTTLYVSVREGTRSVNGFLDEYAYYSAALLSLYEVTMDPFYRKRAEQICEEVQQQFADQNHGGYFLYGTKNSSLIMKPKETYDGALPSGNSVMAYVLVRLSQLTEQEKYQQRAESQLAYLSSEAVNYPAGYCMFLTALLAYLHPRKKITVVCSGQDEEEQIMARLPLYADITILSAESSAEGEQYHVAESSAKGEQYHVAESSVGGEQYHVEAIGSAPLVKEAHSCETSAYKLLNGKTTYYVCENHTCLPPTNEMI